MANVYELSLAFVVLFVVGDFSVQAQGSYVYLGCFWDDMNRALPDLTMCEPPCETVCSTTSPYCGASMMTVDFCLELCQSKQFKYAGLQSNNQCFCGRSQAAYSRYGEYPICNAPCAGNSSQICGDVFRNSVYEIIYKEQICPLPNQVTNGRISSGAKTEYIEGDTITYVCVGNTIVIGNPSRICLSSGMWNNPLPECKTSCNQPLVAMESNRGTPVPVQEVSTLAYVEGELYLIPCIDGHSSTSNPLLAICLGDGTWNYNSTDTVCTVITCPTPVLSEGVVITGTDFTFSKTITYMCVEGYTSSVGVSIVRECQADGTWSGTDLSCRIVTCSPPEIPSNSAVTPGPYNFGDIVMYFCTEEGAKMVGNATRMCTASGLWSGQVPICKAITTIQHPTTPVATSFRTSMPAVTTFITNIIGTQPRGTTPFPTALQRLTTTTTTMHTPEIITTYQQTTPFQGETSIVQTVTDTNSVTESRMTMNANSSPEVVDTSSSSELVTSSTMPSTTEEGLNEKAKSDKSPADYLVLIVICACVFSVLLLSLIFTVAFVKPSKKKKSRTSKSINFISSKETGSMDILWPEDISHGSPRSRADSGLPPSDRNSPTSNGDTTDAVGGVVNLGFENDETNKPHGEDPYHRIDFAVVNESNNRSNNVLMNSGILSPAPQTQDNRSSTISHSRMNSFQQPEEDVDSLYAKVDISKKTKINNISNNTQNNLNRSGSVLSDYKSEENPLYETSSRPTLVLPPDSNNSNSNGVVRKTSRRTPSDVSVSSRSYWAQYEEQVTRL